MKNLEYSNEEVLFKLQNNDEDVIRYLVDKHHKHLLITSYYITKDITISEDIIQDAFVTLWENRRKLESFSVGYLVTCIKNKSISLNRKRKVDSVRKTVYSYFLEKTVSTNKLENSELGEQLLKTISLIPEKQRECFLLQYVENKSQKEISQLKNITISTIKAHVSMALHFLRKELKKY